MQLNVGCRTLKSTFLCTVRLVGLIDMPGDDAHCKLPTANSPVELRGGALYCTNTRIQILTCHVLIVD